MAGTKEGGKKLKKTLIAKYGSEAAYTEFMRSVGTKGGKAVHSKPRGFAARPDIVHVAAKKGGLAAKRKREESREHF